MLKKGFLLNFVSGKTRISKEEKGKDTDAPKDTIPSCTLLYDMFSYMDPLDVALIKDTLSDYFEFDWDSALRASCQSYGVCYHGWESG